MIAVILAAIMLAYVEARNDAADIDAHIPINHVVGWVRRAAFMAFVVGSCYAFGWLGGWVDAGCAIVGSGAAFSFAFRWMLNKRRGLNINYLSPSSWYDWQCIKCFAPSIDRSHAIEHWNIYMTSDSALQAGRAAYITEGIIVLGCVVLYHMV